MSDLLLEQSRIPTQKDLFVLSGWSTYIAFKVTSSLLSSSVVGVEYYYDFESGLEIEKLKKCVHDMITLFSTEID